MGRIVAAISHKGGTGRTTAAANVAYRLALDGTSVCVVDLDLTSPTFGAVLGMSDILTGAPLGMHDLLADPALAEEPGELLRSVWTGNRSLLQDVSHGPAKFVLLPGKDTLEAHVDIGDVESQGRSLALTMRWLSERYEVVILDVRSGASDTVAAVLHAHEQMDAPLDAWLVFFRWTPQHLAGAHELCQRLDKRPAVKTVRTAYADPTGSHKWFGEQHKILETELDALLEDFLPSCTIPFEAMLRWKETVIRDGDVKAGIANQATTTAYRSLAKVIQKL